jgi:hypothetical protein
VTDLWQDEGFGTGGGLGQAFDGDDDWDEGEESLETDVEDGLDDPEESEDEESWEDTDGEEP